MLKEEAKFVIENNIKDERRIEIISDRIKEKYKQKRTKFRNSIEKVLNL